ncbi:MAG: DUF11 domain-containing protein, partial [Deltaproteobacteria bacterium]|nr:DUF11 domain-containing protein [Deltaproteobacteria bacterium]
DTGAFTCPVSATTVSATTTFRVDPVLRVDKRVDFEVAGRDKDITYTLRSVNTGDGAALGPVVVDKLPADLVFVDAAIPSNGQRIWFSAADVPVLPPDVRDTYTWSSSFISASGNFVQGQVSNGRIISPIANPKWIAVLVDDATLTPPQLPADGLAREVSFKMHVPATMQLDRVILNEANISAQGLPRAVSNRPQTLISDDPALRITGECVSAIAALENRHFIQTFTNTSTNDDTSVSARLTVPLADVTPVALTVTSPSGTFSVPLTGGQNVTFTTNVDLMTIAWNVTAHLGRPLAAGEAVTMDLEFEAKSTLTTGASVNLSAQGSASNLTGSVEVGAQCQTLVANPDLRIFKLVDRDRVVAGDTVNYTLVIDNIGAHDVTNAVIRELLPSGLTYVAGSARVSPASWSLQNIAPFATGGTDPLNGGQVLEWSLAQGNAIDGPTTPAGTIPASSPRIYLSFRANVTATAAGTEINNCAKTAIGPEANGDQLGDEAPGNNEACVVIRLPYPDPKILKTGPADVLPGASFAYTLTWANGSRQPADNVVFFERVPNFDFGADANPDLTVSSVAAPSGVEVFYASAAYTSNAATDHPAFDFANPTGSGTWKSSIAALGGAPATWIAFKVGALAGLAAPRSATVQVSAIDPDTFQPVAAGATIENCASIEMSGLATQDETPGNNTSCIITRVPGLNIAVQKTCDPSGFYPGARPGDTVRFVIDIKNVGYSASYGVRVTDVLPTWFELAGLESNIATAVESSGAESSFVDALGQPIAGGVTWTRDGDDWRLGTNANGDARYYRKVGMRPDTATQLVVFGRVALDTAAETLASNTVTVATDRRDNLEESETILADNTASCSFTVHRPDPAVEKFVALPSTANGAASPGDILDYAIGYDNLGLAAASGVELEDLMPVGVTFIVGSVTDVPDGATLEYFDGSDWNYTPSGADGTPDANVKGIRVSFGTFPAPLVGNFNQNSQGSFARGTYDGTHWDADLGAVVATVGSNVTTPTYTSPLIPTDGSQVQEWISFIGHAAPGSTRPEIDLLDVNGDVIGTIQPDVPDSIALGDFVDPTVNELVQLRARFQSPNAGRYDAGFTFLEPAAEGLPQDGEVWLLSGDFAAGLVYPHVAYGGYGEGGGGSPGATSAALWQKVNGTWQLVSIEQPAGVQIGSIDYLSDNLLI